MAPASGMPIAAAVVDEVRELLGGDHAVVVGVDILPVVVREEVIDRVVALDRRDGVGDVDGGVGTDTSCRPGKVGRRGDAAAVVGIERRHGRPGQDAVDAAGIVPGRQVLEGVLAEVERIDPDRRGQVGVGGVAVGRGQVGPVIEGRGDQRVGTGHDRRRHRRADLGEREVVGHGRSACRRSCCVLDVEARTGRRNVGTLKAGAAKSVASLRLTPRPRSDWRRSRSRPRRASWRWR